MPDKTYSFRLIVHGPDDYSAEFEIRIGITTIGREPDNLIYLSDHTISRHHASLECLDSECYITDLESKNGTYINGQKIKAKIPMRLSHQDQVRLGPHYQMVFLRTETKEEEPSTGEPYNLQLEEVPDSPEKTYFGQSSPPPPPTPPPGPLPSTDGTGELVPLGLSMDSSYLLKYLPGIYHTKLMARFLGIFEAILMPIKWTADNFDQYLSPRTAPSTFLPWLANWYDSSFDSTWSEAQRRQFLEDAWLLYARCGTKWALSRVLEIYTGKPPKIEDLADDLGPNMFRVRVFVSEENILRASIESLINYYKPAHTDYELYFQE